MRKNSKFYLGVLLVSCMLGTGTPAQAQLVAGVSFDFLGDAASAVTPVFEQIQTATDEAVKFAKEKVTKLKASLGSYFSKRKNVAEKVPGTKKFAESSVDIHDPEAVKAAIDELFLQYPSSDPRVNKFYEKEAAEFYYDTMIEIQTASKKTEEQLSSLRTEIDEFAKNSISPSGGTGTSMSSEDENGNYYNLYLAHKKFNDVLKVTEEVMALYSQYYVARAIYRKIILPAPYRGEEKKEDKLSSSKYFSSKIAFAQFVSGNVASLATEEETEEPEAQTFSLYKPVEFGTPEAPEAKSLMAGSEKQLALLGDISEAQKALNSALKAHNAINLMPSYRNIFQQYELFKQMHAKAAQAVATSDQCVVQYLGRHYAQPQMVWYGSSKAPQNPVDYDNRKGLSGWAVSAFQVANADKTAGMDTDSFGKLELGADLQGTDVNDLNKVQNSVAQMDEGKALASPSQEEAFTAAAREVELVAWQIGAEAAKVLAQDQQSANPLYGRADEPFPLWQDQKSFYKQYIDGKYENMKAYIRQADLSAIALDLAQIMNDEREDGTAKSSAQRSLREIASYLEDADSSDASGNSLVAEKMAAVSKIENAKKVALKPYELSKDKLLSQLDEVSELINILNDEISMADSEVAAGEAKVESSHNSIKNMNNRGDTDNSTLYAVARADFSEGSKQAQASREKANNLRLQVKEKEAQRDEINAQLEKVNQQIADIEEDYVNRKSAVEAQYTAKLADVAASERSVMTLSGLVDKLGVGTLGLSSIVSNADGMVSEAKNYAIKEIDKARQDIYALGEGLYETASNGAVVRRHQELIDKLKKMPKEQFVRTAMAAVSGDNVSAVTSVLSGALNTVITQRVCGKVACNSADDEFFVGLGAKPRDFKAPKAPEFERYPSPRDVVHFDATDYKNIKKSKDGVLSKSSFLGYGGYIPKIWKQMLSDDAFVERGVNLSSLLEQGGESKFFMRGALYPCRIGRRTVDVAASKVDLSQTSGQYLVSQTSTNKIPECQDVALKGSIYYTITDLELDKSVRAGNQETPATVYPSELGTLLAYENQKLRFNETAYDVYERMLDLEEKAKKEGFEYEVRDNVYQKAMYSQNQIGNFLHFVDKENSIRKNVDELKLSIDDARKNISDMLSEMGFKVNSNFNLANESEYNYIRNKLIEYKNNLIGRAASKISGIGSQDAVVKERYDKVENTRAALVQDYDALVELNNSTAAGSTLEERIKSERAGLEVMEKSQKEALDAIRKEINNYEKPMCVAY